LETVWKRLCDILDEEKSDVEPYAGQSLCAAVATMVGRKKENRMSQKILQINFKFHVSQTDYETAVTPLAEPVAAVPGLIWKVWLMNAAEQESGGIHLFENSQALEAYLSSDLVAGFASNPALSDFSVKQFEVMAGVSEITRAPMGTAEAARHL
jgi:hypothetical protein